MVANEPSGSRIVTEPPGTTASAVVASAQGGYSFHHAQNSIVWAMVVNLLIALIKLAGWFVSRSSTMLSEALHSFGDSINSFALLIGIKLGSKEPDRTHPYGYGLEASVWAITACV